MAGKSVKLLVVSASVFPKRSASAFVVEKLARQFSLNEMTVVGELAATGRANIERPSTAPRFHYIRSGISLWGRGARFFAPLRWRLFRVIVRRICDIARREGCNYILGVYPDELYCCAAYDASVRLKLPFSSYFHNTYLDNAAITNRRAAEIQSRIFERSDHIFVMSEGMKRFYDEQYGRGKFVPLLHTFEEHPAPENVEENNNRCGKTRLVLFGNFNESNIEATRRLVDAVKGNDKYELNIYTDVPRMLLSRRGLDVGATIYHGSLGHLSFADLIAELRQYDIFVLTHGFMGAYGDVEYRTIFPTRAIPMLLSGRPMLVHSPPNSFLTEFFRENRCAAVVDEPSPDAILIALKRIEENAGLRAELVFSAREAAEQFYGPNVANLLRAHLSEGPAIIDESNHLLLERK
jgi:hypothetical protein